MTELEFLIIYLDLVFLLFVCVFVSSMTVHRSHEFSLWVIRILVALICFYKFSAWLYVYNKFFLKAESFVENMDCYSEVLLFGVFMQQKMELVEQSMTHLKLLMLFFNLSIVESETVQGYIICVFVCVRMFCSINFSIRSFLLFI